MKSIKRTINYTLKRAYTCLIHSIITKLLLTETLIQNNSTLDIIAAWGWIGCTASNKFFCINLDSGASKKIKSSKVLPCNYCLLPTKNDLHTISLARTTQAIGLVVINSIYFLESHQTRWSMLNLLLCWLQHPLL